MTKGRHLGGLTAAVAVAAVLWAVPAEATVHEIVAQWCSGQSALAPPGISQGGSKNFAKPLQATGVLQIAFDPVLSAIVVSFDSDHPASKVINSGNLVQIGTTPEGVPVLLNIPIPDPDFPAFQHCPRLAS